MNTIDFDKSIDEWMVLRANRKPQEGFADRVMETITRMDSPTAPRSMNNGPSRPLLSRFGAVAAACLGVTALLIRMISTVYPLIRGIETS
jgi:hypothetical protein